MKEVKFTNEDIDDDISDERLAELRVEREILHEKYADLCPNSDVIVFAMSALAIAIFPERNLPNQNVKKSNQSYLKTVNAELRTLRNSISKLSPATKELIIRREIEQVEERLNSSVGDPDYLVTRNQIGSIRHGGQNCIDKLSDLIEDHDQKKRNVNRESIARQTASLWLRHGGLITTSISKDEGFIAFLERIIEDSGCNYDAVSMIKNYNLQDQSG
jgi:hypothetical protein